MRAALLLFVLGCSSSSSTPPPATTAPVEDAATAPVRDAAPSDAGLGPDGRCADSFGSALTEGFGRIDGIVYAVQKPSDTSCVMPNDDHVIVQVQTNGAVYRLVVNVQSDRAGQDPKVRYLAKAAALPAPAWAEGWHKGAALDYPTTLGAHTGDFTPFAMDELVSKIASELAVGSKVSVYGWSGAGRPESAHKIHKNSGTGTDGAIVAMGHQATQRFLLFHFDGQTF
jgi:hypothetical protein